MTTTAGRALAQQYDALTERAATHRCACGRDVVVAYKDGAYVLRCGACGYDPELRRTETRTLKKLYRQGMPLSALDKQTLWGQLYRQIRNAEDAGRQPDPATVALLRRLEDEMAGNSNNALTVRVQGEVVDYTQDEIALIKSTIAAKDVTDTELRVGLAMARHNGLDPFAKEVYFVKYGGKLALVTGIDGYRKRASQSGVYAGTDDIEYGPDVEDRGVTGMRRPAWAGCTVYKIVAGVRCAFSARVRWEEFARTYNSSYGDRWKEAPYHMLGKCAEAQALRRAFPETLRDLQFTAEDRPVPSGPVVDHATGEIIDGEPQPPVDDPSPPEPTPQTADGTLLDLEAAIDGAASPEDCNRLNDEILRSGLTRAQKTALQRKLAEQARRLAGAQEGLPL